MAALGRRTLFALVDQNDPIRAVDEKLLGASGRYPEVVVVKFPQTQQTAAGNQYAHQTLGRRAGGDLGAFVASVLDGTPPAPTCGGRTAYRTDFQAPSRDWGKLESGVTGGGGVMQLQPMARHVLGEILTPVPRGAGMAVCADVRLDSGEPTASAGLVFGLSKPQSFLTFMVDGQGRYTVQQATDGSWSDVVAWSASPVIEEGADVWNQLELDASAQGARFVVNGVEVGKLSGDLAPRGTYVGLFASASASAPATLDASNFRVAEGAGN